MILSKNYLTGIKFIPISSAIRSRDESIIANDGLIKRQMLFQKLFYPIMPDFTRHTYAVYAYCDYNFVTKCLFNRVGISLSLFIDRKEDFVQKARQKSKVLLSDISIVFHFPQRQKP